MKSLMIYPGGKTKLLGEISKYLNVHSCDLEYREPFFGGGSVGLNFISDNPDLNNIWINDKDIGVACLWTSLIRHSKELKKRVKAFTPSVKAFYEFKEFLPTIKTCPNLQIVDVGFKKLAVHQMSYSGLGTMAGGPRGGREQKADYKIDSRWSPNYICGKIDKFCEMFSSLQIRDDSCTNYDFEDVIQEDGNAILYVDPPYYVKGNDLYQCGFSHEDHDRLAKVLRKSSNPFVLSYDDCNEIQDLYSWANIFTVGVNYSICNSRNKTELIICPK